MGIDTRLYSRLVGKDNYNCSKCNWRDEEGFCVHKYSDMNSLFVTSKDCCLGWQDKENYEHTLIGDLAEDLEKASSILKGENK